MGHRPKFLLLRFEPFLEPEREIERERQRQTQRGTDRPGRNSAETHQSKQIAANRAVRTQTETEADTDRRDADSDRETETDRESDSDRETETDRETDSQGETDRQRKTDRQIKTGRDGGNRPAANRAADRGTGQRAADADESQPTGQRTEARNHTPSATQPRTSRGAAQMAARRSGEADAPAKLQYQLSSQTLLFRSLLRE